MDGYVTIGTKLDTKDFDRQIRQVESKLADLEDAIEVGKNNKGFYSTRAMEEMEAEAEKLRNRLVDLRAKQDKLSEPIKTANFDNLNASVNNISSKMGNIVQKAIKWGLAVFSIRSAYSFIRSSISTISQYDTQLATNIEYIRWALAMTLKPVIEYIVNMAYKLLGIIRSIIYVLFKYDIFAKAGADAFKKAKESTSGIDNNLGKSVKKAKEINKQLASFDEMNILGDNTKQAGDTSTGGGATGGAIQIPMEIPEITDIKIDWGKIWDTIEFGLGLIKQKLAPTIEGFFTSIGQRFYDNASGWTTPLSNTLGDFFVTLGYNARLSISGIGDVFGGLVKTVRGLFSGDIPTIASGMFQTLTGIFEMGIGSLGIMFNFLSTPFRLAFNTMMSIAEVFFNWLAKQTGIKAIKWDNLMVGLGNTIDRIKNTFNGIKSWIGTQIGKISTKIDWGKMVTGLSSNISRIKSSLKNLGTKVGNVVVSAFKTVFNKMISQVENRLNTPINAINKLISTVNKLLPKSQKLSKLSTISLPRLAKGGIVNLPSSGVPVGSAIAGERGAEGVIPLTDSQQMALLGEAIGRYITINANITNNMNGRVISRELQKIQNDNNFSYNR